MFSKIKLPAKKSNRIIQPKLRLISDCDTAVNSARAERSGAIAIEKKEILKEIKTIRSEEVKKIPKSEIPNLPKPKSLKKVSDDTIVNLFIELDDVSCLGGQIIGETARVGNILTAQLNLDKLKSLITDRKNIKDISYISLGDAITFPQPIMRTDDINKPAKKERLIPEYKSHRNGSKVLIGIIDVGGFDFAHPDFLDKNGNTRFNCIWDQGGGTRDYPKNFNYGSELKQDHLNNAIIAARKINVSPHDIEPQSQKVLGSHGTHVASIAAGNHGVCRNALIAGVLISLPYEDLDRRKSFFDSTRLAHAILYLTNIADELDIPVSINISLGTNGNAHDASNSISRWIDSLLSIPGRSVTVAAGNAGQEKSEFSGDIGYTMGRIHTSGCIPARGLDSDIEWIVVGNTINDISENELEIWYEAQDRFSVSIKPPDESWIGPIEPGKYIENHQLEDKTFISIYNELYHSANGCNYIAIYLTPYLNQPGVVGIKSGRWLVRLHGVDIHNGQYHGWIERDDPQPRGQIGTQQFWSFPSYFSELSNADNSSVSSLACGHRIVSVANLDKVLNRINKSSSQGPTRDGRSKPDICALGTNVVAAKGFGLPDDRWISMTGTSMSSPYVAGVIGLMLSTERRLTSAQICGIIRRTANPLPGTDYNWQNDSGFGEIDPQACIKEAKTAFKRKEVKL